MSRANRKFDLEKFFVALSDRNRLRLIDLMGEDEVCVCFFVEILKMPQPRVSRHLAFCAGRASWRPAGREVDALPDRHPFRRARHPYLS
jgi:ArsR family transcriptional regulator